MQRGRREGTQAKMRDDEARGEERDREGRDRY